MSLIPHYVCALVVPKLCFVGLMQIHHPFLFRITHPFPLLVHPLILVPLVHLLLLVHSFSSVASGSSGSSVVSGSSVPSAGSSSSSVASGSSVLTGSSVYQAPSSASPRAVASADEYFLEMFPNHSEEIIRYVLKLSSDDLSCASECILSGPSLERLVSLIRSSVITDDMSDGVKLRIDEDEQEGE